MRKLYVTIAAILIAGLMGVVPRLNSSAQTPVNQWPTFHADQERDGISAATGMGTATDSLKALHQYQLGCANAMGNPIACIAPYSFAVRTSPAIDSHGSAYFTAETGRVYDFDLAYAAAHKGVAKWSFLASAPIDSSPTLSIDGSQLYFGDENGDVYAISTVDGTKVWTVNLGGPVRASPLLSTDGKTIYVPQANGTLYALDATAGTTKWSFYPGNGAMPGGVTADQSGTLLYIEVGTNIYALPASGPPFNGERQGYLSGYGAGTPAVDPNGNVFVGTVNGTLDAFPPALINPTWTYQTPCNGSIVSTPTFVTSAAGNLAVFGTCSLGGAGAVRAVSTVNGQQVWQVLTGAPVNSSPAVAKGNGNIYFGSEDNKFYAVSSTGTVLSTPLGTGAGVDSSPAIAADGSIWFGNNAGAIFQAGTIALPPPPLATPTPTLTPIFTPTPTNTPTPTVTPTPIVVPLTITLKKGTVKDGQKQTVTITSAPNTAVHLRVNYPNGDHQSHTVTTNASGSATYSYKQGSSKMKHNNQTATVIATAGTGAAKNTQQQTYKIGFGPIDASAEPRSLKAGKTVDIFVHAHSGSKVVVLLIGPSGKVVTLRGKTGPKGFASIKYTVAKALVTSSKRKVTVVAKFAAGSSASTSTNFTVK